MTEKELQAFQQQCDAYRKNHGTSSLVPYVGHNAKWLCKRHNDYQVTLVNIDSLEELCVSAETFNTQFFVSCMDESVYYFGTPEAKAALTEYFKKLSAATQFCLESKD